MHKTHKNQNKPANLKISQESVSKSMRGHTKNVATSKAASLFNFPGLFSNLRPHNTDLPKTHRNENKPADFKNAGHNFNKTIGGVRVFKIWC